MVWVSYFVLAVWSGLCFRRADAVRVRVSFCPCVCVQREQIPVARKELHRLLENRYSPASSLCLCVSVGG